MGLRNDFCLSETLLGKANMSKAVGMAILHDIFLASPAGIFDSGSVLLNQNVNGCVRTYVNLSRTVAE